MPKQTDVEVEKRRIMQTAAQLIKSNIKYNDLEKSIYPDFEELAS
jgi:hypothetical protein